MRAGLARQAVLRRRRAPSAAAPRPSSISAQWLSVGTGAVKSAATVAGPVTLLSVHVLPVPTWVQPVKPLSR